MMLLGNTQGGRGSSEDNAAWKKEDTGNEQNSKGNG